MICSSSAVNSTPLAWVPETRNLYEDFKRFYPDEEPKEVVRIYLMSDSDNTGSKVTGGHIKTTENPADSRDLLQNGKLF